MADYEFSQPEEVPSVVPLDIEDDMPESELTCKVCGIEIPYAGRGRKPSYCADHKPSKSAGSGKSPANATPKAGGNKLRSELLETFNGLGMMVVMMDQYDGATIISSAPRLAETLAQMAEHYPHFGKYLRDGNKSIVWFQLALALSGLLVPILAHHGLVPIDEKEAFQRFHGKVKVESKEA